MTMTQTILLLAAAYGVVAALLVLKVLATPGCRLPSRLWRCWSLRCCCR
jgi:hypothetical protein